ncbi:MAG: pyridoxamine 5'-phosphate oxidase family protein, partial [Cyclobacteriaceae bacterium]
MSSPEHKALIWNLIKDVKVGMLTTVSEDNDGSFHARPMSLVQEAYDGTIYFFTHKNSAKVFEVVTEDREVGLTFSEPSNQVYVSLSGHAKVTQDTELIDKYWNPGVAAWFPEGKNSRDVA